MKREYTLGVDSNTISLQVNISSGGNGYTAANLNRSGGERQLLAESSITDAGTIAKRNIGKVSSLLNGVLVIDSIIKFNAIDADELDQLGDSTNVTYIIDGGFSGRQKYNMDIDDVTFSKDKTVMVIRKPIKFI